MERSETKVSKKMKMELVKRMSLIIVSGVLLLFVSFYSFGWFSFNTKNKPGTLQLVTSTESYDLLIETPRRTTYDSDHDYITGEGELKSNLTAKGFNFTAADTTVDTKIAFELVNEFRYENRYYIMPGSYGTVTFYVRPAAGKSSVVAKLGLDIGGYGIVVEEDEENSGSYYTVMREVESGPVLDLMKGHILFFTERTGADYEHYQYDGLIEGEYVFDSRGKTLCEDVGKTDCYKVTLYWEWPITYFELSENLSTSVPEVTRKYPVEVGEYIEEKPEYFFAGVIGPSDVDDLEDYYSGNAERIADALSDLYNDGDQIIGSGAKCIVLYIDAG
ncbi:MAG: hypothetical protein J5762_07100 [Clostridia bacterium]|nr:hypothetical protein [Clostridia bacterium]